MNKYLTGIKDGTRDYIFGECEQKREISQKLSNLFVKWGYSQIATPTFEYMDVFNAGDSVKDEDLFKFTDDKNHLLALKADCTMPIARVAATKLTDEVLPYRLYYNQNVFRSTSKRPETTQCGIELIGDCSLKSDTEVLALSSYAMKEFLGSNFRIEIGHGKLYKVLIKEYGIDEITAENIRKIVEMKNYAAIESMDIPNELKCLPKMFGGVEVLKEYKKICSKTAVTQILDYLRQIYDDLSSMGLGSCISFDLGLVHRLDYYTGIIFGGYVGGFGSSVLSGGRYDNLADNYGRKLKATGFGINVDEIFDIMRKKEKYPRNVPHALIYYENGFSANAYMLAQKMTDEGKIVIISTADSEDKAFLEAEKRGIKRVIIQTDVCTGYDI